jgi:hypothetical protein
VFKAGFRSIDTQLVIKCVGFSRKNERPLGVGRCFRTLDKLRILKLKSELAIKPMGLGHLSISQHLPVIHSINFEKLNCAQESRMGTRK